VIVNKNIHISPNIWVTQIVIGYRINTHPKFGLIWVSTPHPPIPMGAQRDFHLPFAALINCANVRLYSLCLLNNKESDLLKLLVGTQREPLAMIIRRVSLSVIFLCLGNWKITTKH